MITPGQAFEALERERLRVENEALREVLLYYAKPRNYGHGEWSIFVDDCGPARRVLRDLGIKWEAA